MEIDFDARSSVRVCRLMMLCRMPGLQGYPSFCKIICDTYPEGGDTKTRETGKENEKRKENVFR
ncbi:Protein of unknown function [Pyronema omphalodes CBS 100304]|uniref:Uncharacterized protein n=1 Tax=Pyronema omphalodes (strain CBS 100304) TaxID=1076935 RepID=U4L551_PYROM|nr:Protein of unknown function [Pyronema omphalodes CBS 100304]